MFFPAQKIHVEPYVALAPIYDEVMDHVHYDMWADYVTDICEKHELTGKTLLDISCGTGELLYFLCGNGFNVFGSDFEFDMVHQASIKKKYGFDQPQYFCADMQFPPVKKKIDIVASLYDSMNYMDCEIQWKNTLENVYKILNPNGLFIFDVSTLHNSLHVFKNYSVKERVSLGRYYRKSSFDKKTAIQTNYFEIRFKNDPNKIYCETHRQKIRPLEKIEEIIHQSCFAFIAKYRNFSFTEGDEKAERVHYVLKKTDG